MASQEKKTEFEPRIVAFLCNWCSYRGAQMFSKRESKMLQHYIIEYGKMPKTNQEMEDLF